MPVQRLSSSFNRTFMVVYYNAKIIGYVPILVAVACTVVISTVFNLRFSTYSEIAQVGEMYLSLLGIILLPHLSIVEDTDSIHETVYPRRFRHVLSVLYRLLFTGALLWFLIMSVVMLAKLQGSEFPWLEITGGVWISAMGLGAAGLTAATFSRNIAAAYITGYLYYVLELFTKGKYTGDLYLFSLLRGQFEQGKWGMAIIIAVVLAVNLVYVWRKS